MFYIFLRQCSLINTKRLADVMQRLIAITEFFIHDFHVCERCTE